MHNGLRNETMWKPNFQQIRSLLLNLDYYLTFFKLNVLVSNKLMFIFIFFCKLSNILDFPSLFISISYFYSQIYVKKGKNISCAQN